MGFVSSYAFFRSFFDSKIDVNIFFYFGIRWFLFHRETCIHSTVYSTVIKRQNGRTLHLEQNVESFRWSHIWLPINGNGHKHEACACRTNGRIEIRWSFPRTKKIWKNANFSMNNETDALCENCYQNIIFSLTDKIIMQTECLPLSSNQKPRCFHSAVEYPWQMLPAILHILLSSSRRFVYVIPELKTCAFIMTFSMLVYIFQSRRNFFLVAARHSRSQFSAFLLRLSFWCDFCAKNSHQRDERIMSHLSSRKKKQTFKHELFPHPMVQWATYQRRVY